MLVRLCGLRDSVVGDLERRGCGTFRERGEGYERGVYLADHGSLVHVFRTHRRSYEDVLVVVAFGDTIGYVGSDEGWVDGVDFEVVDDSPRGSGSSLDVDLCV